MIYRDLYKQKGLRLKLVSLLKQKGIQSEAVLEAFEKVPRHYFLDSAFEIHAYEDKAFPIGFGQTISQPYTVAFQTELLELKPTDKVLEIGTGSGFQGAILSLLAFKVYSIERDRNLFNRVSVLLKRLNYKVKCFYGDGTLGLPSYGPFDKILVTASAPKVPNALLDQLVIGGKLVIPVGDRSEQKMIRLTKISENKVSKEEFGMFRFVPLIGQDGWEK